MRTVNEITFGSQKERNPKEQEKFLATFADVIRDDEALRNVQHEFCSVYGKSYGIIPRFGEASFNEMLGKIRKCFIPFFLRSFLTVL